MLTPEQILNVQKRLASYGYLYKEPDGIWDDITMSGYRGWLARYKFVLSTHVTCPLSLSGVPKELLEDFQKPSTEVTQESGIKQPTAGDPDDEPEYEVEAEAEIEDEVEEEELEYDVEKPILKEKKRKK